MSDAAASPVRAALVGFGLAGQAFHAPFLTSVPGLQLTSIVTTDAARRATAEARYPQARLLSSAEEVWATASAHDLVVIATSNRSHALLAHAALDAGLHVVIDKPMAATSVQAWALVDHARQRDRVLTVFQNRRWDSELLTLRRVIDDGALGEVQRFESRFERWRPRAELDRWRESADPADAGGLLFDLGSHLIDQAIVLFGPPRQVYAEVACRRAGVRVDDDVFVALTHADDVRSHLWVSATAAHLGPRLRVLGSAGAFVVDELDAQEAQLRAGVSPYDASYGEVPEARWGRLVVGAREQAIRAVPGAYQRFYEGVVAAVTEGAAPPVPPADAVRVIEVIEAAARSAASASVVSLEPAG